MLLSRLEGLRVFDPRGRYAGKVSRALFDAEQPVLVGFEVRLKPLLYLIERRPRYVVRDGVSLSRDGLMVQRPARLEREEGRKGGVDWEQVVVWTGMSVATESDAEPLGVLKDADLGSEGRVKRIMLTRGATSDTAIGTREIEGTYVRRFDRGAIRVDDSFEHAGFSGGLAAEAGKGAAVAKVKAGQAAAGAVRTAAAAARTAKRSGIGRRAGDSWRGFAKGFREGISDDEGESSGGPRDRNVPEDRA